MQTSIGNISNYYGGLHVKEENGKFYWTIEDWDGVDFKEEIPEFLYNSLMKYQKQENKKLKNK